MSKLLMDDYPLIVLPQLAQIIGLNEAIVVQQIHYLRLQPNFGEWHDGRKWVRMTLREWKERHFPFWSEATIQRTLDSLEEMGLVVSTDEWNKLGFDRTKWYAIDDDHFAKLEIHPRNLQNGAPQNEPTIPETSSEINISADDLFPDAPEPAPRMTAEQAKASLRATLSNPNLGKGAAVSNPFEDKQFFVKTAVFLMASLCSEAGLNDRTMPLYRRMANEIWDNVPRYANNDPVPKSTILEDLGRLFHAKRDFKQPQFLVKTNLPFMYAKLMPGQPLVPDSEIEDDDSPTFQNNDSYIFDLEMPDA